MSKSSSNTSGGVRSIGRTGFSPTSQVHGVGAQPPRGGAVAKGGPDRGHQNSPKADRPMGKGC